MGRVRVDPLEGLVVDRQVLALAGGSDGVVAQELHDGGHVAPLGARYDVELVVDRERRQLPTLHRRHEDAEGVPRRVAEDVERLVLGVRAVHDQGRAERLRPPTRLGQGVQAGDGHVDVQLHRDLRRRPGRGRQLADLLEGESRCALRGPQDEPVGVVGASVHGRFVTRAVDEPQELAVELCEASNIGGVQGGLAQARTRCHGANLTGCRSLVSSCGHVLGVEEPLGGPVRSGGRANGLIRPLTPAAGPVRRGASRRIAHLDGPIKSWTGTGEFTPDGAARARRPPPPRVRAAA